MAPNVGTSAMGASPLGYEHLLYTGKWWQNRGILMLNAFLFLPLISSYANGFDGSMMNGLQSVTWWQDFFGKPKGGKLGLFNAIQNIGALAGIPFAPYAADILGRKPTIIFGAFVVCIGAAIQSASQNFGMFIGARALIGFGTSFVQLASPLLVSELAYPSHRAALTSLFNTMWFSGAIVAAWATFGTFRIANNWSWRIPSLLQALPSILQLILIWGIPESPRYLVKKGKDERALRILTKYHANGNRDDPLIEFEYNEIKEAIALEERLAKSTSYLQLFNSKGNLKRMRIIIAIAFFSQWSGNGLISYYLNLILDGIGITSALDQTLINGILQIFNFAVAITASLLTERLGRRTLFLASTIGMTVFYACITICAAVYRHSVTLTKDGKVATDPATGKLTGNANAAHAYIACVFLFNFWYAIAYTPLLVSYTVEILPYEIRAKGLAVMNLMVTAALVFNQYTNPIAWDALNWKYYIVYTVWDIFETGYIYMFAVETKGRSLEETAVIFDDLDGTQANALAAAAAAQTQGLHHRTNAGIGDKESGSEEKYDLSEDHRERV